MNQRFIYLAKMLALYDYDNFNTADIYAFCSNKGYSSFDMDEREFNEALELLKLLVVEEKIIFTNCRYEYEEMKDEYGFAYLFEHIMDGFNYKIHWENYAQE